MNMKALVLSQPGRDVVMLMSTVIVDNQMQRQTARSFSIELAQELQILLMPVAGQAGTNHCAVQHIEGGKESSGAVSLIVMRRRAAATFLHWQSRLSSFQSLNLALFVHAQNERFFGRIQVQAHYVRQLFYKVLVTRQLESAAAVRLQSVGIPDALHRSRTDSMRSRHRAHAPMGRRFGSSVQSRLDNLFNLRSLDAIWSAPSRSIIDQRRRSALQKTVTPKNHRRPTRLQLTRDLIIRNTAGSQQHDARSKHHFLRTVASPDPSLQGLSLIACNRQRCRGFPHNAPQFSSAASYCKAICETLH